MGWEMKKAESLLTAWSLTAIEWKLGLAALLATVFDMGGGYFLFRGYAMSPYRLLIFLLLGVFAVRVIFSSHEWMLPRPASHVAVFLVFWGGYGALSLLWAANLAVAARGLAFLGLGLATALVFSLVLKPRRALAAVPKVWIAGMICLVAVGAWERITGNHLPISAYLDTTEILLRHTPTGFFSEPNVYSTVLALGFPFLLLAVIAARRRFLRAGMILVAATVPWLVLAADSRANILALGVEIAALLVCVIRPLRRWRVGLAAVVLLISVCLAFPQLPASVLHLSHRGTGVTADTSPTSLSIRLETIRQGLRLLASTHGAGVGPGGFEYEMRSVNSMNLGSIRDMHNWWAQVLVEYGVLVFAGYRWRFVTLLWSLLAASRKADDDRLRHVGEALFCSLVGFSFASMSPSSIVDLPVQWALLGLCIAYVAYAGTKEAKLCTS
jgi:teichuronic acid biosynthesis protein TuaE